jgi:hypothetical protein
MHGAPGVIVVADIDPGSREYENRELSIPLVYKKKYKKLKFYFQIKM